MNDLTVAGRTFRPVTVSTFENQLYMMPLVRAAGLADADAKVQAATSEEAAEALLYRVIESRHTIGLLAGVLVEAGETWSPASADRNAAFFATLTDPADMAKLQAALVGLVAHFFGLAVSVPAPSDTSLPSPAAHPASASLTTNGTAATSTSESGGTSSAPSPASTRTRSRASSAGRSGKGSSRTSPT